MYRIYRHERGSPRRAVTFNDFHEAQTALDNLLEEHRVARRVVSVREVLGRTQWDAYDEDGLVCRFWLEPGPQE